MSEPIDNTNYQLANAMYQEGGDYMKARTIRILKAELERHRKGSSGYATVEQLLNKVLELQSVT
jgi:hypothetical protein